MFPTQKTINYGGKQTGKIVGGMYFVNNTTETNLSSATFVNIGTGFAGHLPFELTIPYSSGNDYYFDITGGVVTASQKLRYFKGKNGTQLTMKWSLTVESVDAGPGFTNNEIFLRISKTDVDSVTTVISDSVSNCSTNQFGMRISGVSIVSVNVGDSFFIQLEQLAGLNVLVPSAELILVE